MEPGIKILKESELGLRPSWDEYFMKWALDVASRSSCFNVHAGSVVVLDNRMIGTGYNGAPPGVKSCLERGACYKETKTGKKYEDTMNTGRCIGVHSEMNALAHLNKLIYKGVTLYVTIFPCTSCAKNLLAYGVKRIVFKREYDEGELGLVLDLFQEAGIEVCQLDLSPERYLDIGFNHPNVKFDIWSAEEKQMINRIIGGKVCEFEEKNINESKLNLNL